MAVKVSPIFTRLRAACRRGSVMVKGLHQSARRINERDSVSIQIDANHSARHDNLRADRAGWQLSLRCTNGRSGRVIVRNFGSPPRQQVSFSDVRLSSSRSSWRIA
jgi:hypothetical protein